MTRPRLRKGRTISSTGSTFFFYIFVFCFFSNKTHPHTPTKRERRSSKGRLPTQHETYFATFEMAD